MTMETKLIGADRLATFTYILYVKDTPQRIFDALTIPEQTAQFWGIGNVSDWQPGSHWQHLRADGDGKPELVGEVIESVPPERLVITWANADEADDPGAYSRVTFEFDRAQDDQTRLTLTHCDLEGGMLKAISQGWPVVLSGLKTFVETGEDYAH